MNPKNIKFTNQKNTRSQFDILKLEELYKRKNIDHSIEEPHKVEFFILLFVEKGNGKHAIDFVEHKCSKGTLLTIRKDQIHRFYKKGNLKGCLLIFTDEFLISYLEELETQKTMLLFNELLGVPKIQLTPNNFKSISQIISRIHHEYFNVNDNHSLGIIRSELHILITQLFRIKSKQENYNATKKYLSQFIIFQKMVEININKTAKVQEYADKMHISTKTLNNITKTIVNKSAKEFIDEIRTLQIKRLLINTKLSIKEIAYESGFEESTNFYKYFKRHTRSTPEQFRETH